jgi:hypothetical protein
MLLSLLLWQLLMLLFLRLLLRACLLLLLPRPGPTVCIALKKDQPQQAEGCAGHVTAGRRPKQSKPLLI